jgi:nucleoside-diphosphate kinase
MSRFNQSSVGEFYGEHKERDFYGNLVTFMLSDVVVGMELVKDNAVEEWRKCIGPTDSD